MQTKLPLTVHVQYCINCPEHSNTFRHNQSQYLSAFQLLKSAFQEEIVGIQIHGNQAPGSYKIIKAPMNDNHVQSNSKGYHRFHIKNCWSQSSDNQPLSVSNNRYYDQQKKKFIIFPRVGAFEITVKNNSLSQPNYNSITIFSKLQSGLWPNRNHIIKLFQNILRQLQEDTNGQKWTQLLKKYEVSRQSEHLDTRTCKRTQFRLRKQPSPSLSRADRCFKQSNSPPGIRKFTPKSHKNNSKTKGHSNWATGLKFKQPLSSPKDNRNLFPVESKVQQQGELGDKNVVQSVNYEIDKLIIDYQPSNGPVRRRHHKNYANIYLDFLLPKMLHRQFTANRQQQNQQNQKQQRESKPEQQHKLAQRLKQRQEFQAIITTGHATRPIYKTRLTRKQDKRITTTATGRSKSNNNKLHAQDQKMSSKFKGNITEAYNQNLHHKLLEQEIQNVNFQHHFKSTDQSRISGRKTQKSHRKSIRPLAETLFDPSQLESQAIESENNKTESLYLRIQNQEDLLVEQIDIQLDKSNTIKLIVTNAEHESQEEEISLNFRNGKDRGQETDQTRKQEDKKNTKLTLDQQTSNHQQMFKQGKDQQLEQKKCYDQCQQSNSESSKSFIGQNILLGVPLDNSLPVENSANDQNRPVITHSGIDEHQSRIIRISETSQLIKDQCSDSSKVNANNNENNMELVMKFTESQMVSSSLKQSTLQKGKDNNIKHQVQKEVHLYNLPKDEDGYKLDNFENNLENGSQYKKDREVQSDHNQDLVLTVRITKTEMPIEDQKITYRKPEEQDHNHLQIPIDDSIQKQNLYQKGNNVIHARTHIPQSGDTQKFSEILRDKAHTEEEGKQQQDQSPKLQKPQIQEVDQQNQYKPGDNPEQLNKKQNSPPFYQQQIILANKQDNKQHNNNLKLAKQRGEVRLVESVLNASNLTAVMGEINKVEVQGFDKSYDIEQEDQIKKPLGRHEENNPQQPQQNKLQVSH